MERWSHWWAGFARTRQLGMCLRSALFVVCLGVGVWGTARKQVVDQRALAPRAEPWGKESL
jgi:hypothetical protein